MTAVRIFSSLFCFFLCCHSVIAQTTPNIILIIADDVSWDDLGCYGNKAIRTPNIDRLAKDGMKFTNAFVTSSSCSPSRSSIITGRYPHNTGAAELHTPLPAHLPFFPELLKNKGYYTAQVGKWHEGEYTKRAYDTLIAGKRNGDGGEELWLSMVRDRSRNQPFFFWLAPFDAHREWEADSLNQPHDPAEIIVPTFLSDTKETREDIAAYYNEIARLDYYVGALEKELYRQGIHENTMIIFMSDNGRPFPRSKTRLIDAGVKTPFLIKWPKGIQKGSECHSLVSAIDIAPTLLELAEIKPLPTMQGRSFSELFKNPDHSFRNYIFTEHNWHDYEAYERAVRTKDYLYIINRRPGFANQGPLDAVNSKSFKALKESESKGTITPIQKDILLSPRPAEELFDLKKDGAQMDNLANKPTLASVKNNLKEVLSKWQKETGDTAPSDLTPDWYDRVNGKKTAVHNQRGEMPGKSLNADKINAKGAF